MGDDSLGGDSDNQSIFGGVVFILVLSDESLSGEVVGFTLSSSFEFGLESHEICFVLDELDESHVVDIKNYINIK